MTTSPTAAIAVLSGIGEDILTAKTKGHPARRAINFMELLARRGLEITPIANPEAQTNDGPLMFVKLSAKPDDDAAADEQSATEGEDNED